MACGLYKYKKETATHYVGRTGNEYPVDEYNNHGWEGIKKSYVANEGTIIKKDLPADEYPYTRKYNVELLFKCCEVCSCENKN